MWGKPQHEILETFTSRELDELRAYSMLESFGPREDLRKTVEIVCAIYNTTPKSEQYKNKIFKPEDFIPSYELIGEKLFKSKIVSDRDKTLKMKEQLQAIAKAHEGKMKDGGNLARKKILVKR